MYMSSFIILKIFNVNYLSEFNVPDKGKVRQIKVGLSSYHTGLFEGVKIALI